MKVLADNLSLNQTRSCKVFLPQTPESFTYDDDGNLTQDGRWTYTWDAENRLVKVEILSSNPSGSKRKVEWVYDARAGGFNRPPPILVPAV